MNHSKVSANRFSYVIITPAKNEAAYIEQTIKSMIAQTQLPTRWVIVNDGSTDGTDDIVSSYSRKHEWIELLSLPVRSDRCFGGKAIAFNTGYERVKHINADIIGNVDADISFERDYMAFLLEKFEENPKLGIAGTPFMQESQQYDYRFTSLEHVSGACQLFRRKCFESIGGYSPLKEGGIDLLAVIKARMNGWKTRTFLEKSCIHHRKMGAELNSGLDIPFKGGRHDYQMGVNIIWQFFRCFYQMTRKPYIVFGSAILAGYLWGMITRANRLVPEDVIAFRRREQLGRLRKYFRELLGQNAARND
jgi:glycosyltransferase involved in cell wall biosynthesis